MGGHGSLWPYKTSWWIEQSQCPPLGKCDNCYSWISCKFWFIDGLVCCNSASDITFCHFTNLTCYVVTLTRTRRTSTSLKRGSPSSYMTIQNMSHSWCPIPSDFQFHLRSTLPFMVHVPRSLIYPEQLRALTSSTETWMAARHSIWMAPLQTFWNMPFLN